MIRGVKCCYCQQRVLQRNFVAVELEAAHMYSAKENLPVTFELPGVTIRSTPWHGMAALYVTLAAGSNFTPVLKGSQTTCANALIGVTSSRARCISATRTAAKKSHDLATCGVRLQGTPHGAKMIASTSSLVPSAILTRSSTISVSGLDSKLACAARATQSHNVYARA